MGKQQGRNSHNFYQNAQICCHPQPCCLRLRRPIRPRWSRLCPPTDPLPHQVQHQVHQQCHQEYDTVVDTTYTQQCQDIVTKHCQSTHKQVHHSSAVVGHDSEAEPGYGSQGYSSGPQCQQHVEKQCQKVPL